MAKLLDKPRQKEELTENNNEESVKIKFFAFDEDLMTKKPTQWFLKRAFDYTASLSGLILISPLLLVVAALIKLDSEGPVFYKQKRIGLFGREFEMYKFRSMKKNADREFEKLKALNETNELMFKIFDDPRITKVGKFIRKYSIDELPQLINVLKGDMSLVGPRPPLPREVQYYEERHFKRLSTVPGLTGLWQVSGRSNVKDFDTVLKLDTAYIQGWNLLMDFKIILKTFPVVLFAKNAA